MCRQYCTRRLRRIYKSVKFLHGRGRYQKKKLEPEGVKDVRCRPLPLHKAFVKLGMWRAQSVLTGHMGLTSIEVASAAHARLA